MVSGLGNLLDRTPVYYTAVMVGNQPLIGMNLFSIAWTTPAGSFFHRSGAMINGFITVPRSSRNSTGDVLDRTEHLPFSITLCIRKWVLGYV